MTSDTVSLPEDFTVLPIPLPPMLAALVGHNGISRVFSLCYFGSKATWSTGWVSSTFSYAAGYQPLLEHPVLALHLFDFDFGNDDGPPQHALLCDRQTARMAVGTYTEVQQFLRQANPPPPCPSADEIAAMRQYFATMTMEEMREMGMFEFLFGLAPAQRQLGGALVAWLDQFITPALLRQAPLPQRRLSAAAGEVKRAPRRGSIPQVSYPDLLHTGNGIASVDMEVHAAIRAGFGSDRSDSRRCRQGRSREIAAVVQAELHVPVGAQHTGVCIRRRRLVLRRRQH